MFNSKSTGLSTDSVFYECKLNKIIIINKIQSPSPPCKNGLRHTKTETHKASVPTTTQKATSPIILHCSELPFRAVQNMLSHRVSELRCFQIVCERKGRFYMKGFYAKRRQNMFCFMALAAKEWRVP